MLLVIESFGEIRSFSFLYGFCTPPDRNSNNAYCSIIVSKNMKQFLTLLFILCCGMLNNAYAQQTNSVNKLSDDLLNFFIGPWTDMGEFANGKKISAEITLDSSWLSFMHKNRLPNRYKALSMGVLTDKQGSFLHIHSTIFTESRNLQAVAGIMVNWF